MDKTDTLHLFDAKMELHPEEESFSAQPTILLRSNSWNRCNGVLIGGIVVVVVGLIAGAFVAGYMIRSAVTKVSTDCKTDDKVSPTSLPSQIRLQDILALMSTKSIEHNLRNLTLKPHHASSRRNKELAEMIKAQWTSYGFDVKLVRYNVLLSFPVEGKINGVALLDGNGSVMFRSANREEVLEPMEQSSDVLRPFSAFSPTGKAKGDLVYVNYARPIDFKMLIDKGVNCSGKIVIARYGHVFRGDKVTNAQKYGAKAILIYSDPYDYAPVRDEDLYPHGWWLPQTGVQRGSILIGTGDPLTPRYPAKDGVLRKKSTEIKMPCIPAHPISAKDAEQFLSRLGGVEAPDDWQGGLNITYRLGPGFIEELKDWNVEVETNNNHTRRDIYNVIAVLKGFVEPDRLVLLGNHRDAWVFGGIDPSSGTACLMEIAKAFGLSYKQGWRPRRSIVLCSWGGEEYGLLGSTEWVEDNIHLLYQRAVAYLNVDSPVRGNYSLYVRASPLLHKVLFAASQQVKNPVNGSQSVYENWLQKFPASDGRNPKIPPLGSGSDYSPFCQRVGVPSADIRYVFDKVKFHNISSYPTYHSIHDTFAYVKKFVDPHFATHLAIAQVWASAAFLLAHTPIVPINCSDYATALRRGALDIKKTYEDDLTQKGISLEYLEKAVQTFEEGSKVIQSFINSVNSSDPWSLSFINDRLTGLEKNFLNPAGLPGRPLYWHSIFAPSLHNSYASATFPGLHDSLQDAVGSNGTWSLVKEELSNTIVAIEWAAQFLNSIV
ncbi:putative N-acetylated-alpha-linked acidic dipeptidase isoform X1 [Acropora palmata]|uniref:putative N-acetylated-alpha-linked acidic dipeptidase isoform X1 n=1 Tax=Acropora palmata TaxID=6131 RepID=UPI003DA0E353